MSHRILGVRRYLALIAMVMVVVVVMMMMVVMGIGFLSLLLPSSQHVIKRVMTDALPETEFLTQLKIVILISYYTCKNC